MLKIKIKRGEILQIEMKANQNNKFFKNKTWICLSCIYIWSIISLPMCLLMENINAPEHVEYNVDFIVVLLSVINDDDKTNNRK